MMNLHAKNILPPLLISLLILSFFEIVSSTIFPTLGLPYFRPAFNILVILYLCLRVESPLIALYILFIQLVHSVFSIEGWALGTFSGVIVGITVSYLREVIHFTSNALIVLIVGVFQILWFGITSILIYIRTGDTAYLIQKFWRFLPEGLFLALISPFVFKLFDKIWKVGDRKAIENEI